MACALHQITLPVRGDGKGDNVFAHAAALAKRFGAHVQVVHCRPAAQDLMPYGVVVPNFLRKQLEDVSRNMADVTEETLRDEFTALAEKFGLPVQLPARGQANTSFLEYTGKQADAVRHYGRLADLICVPKPDKSTNLGYNTLKSALFSSARPVMMCPEVEAVASDLGRHVCIGWNGSLEATRALAMAMPLIEAAEAVTILTAGQDAHATSAEELVTYLDVRGVSARINRFDKDGNVGRKLLDHCASEGGDLLVMGAYHDSYERESIFGGNTQTVVEAAEIPIVLAH